MAAAKRRSIHVDGLGHGGQPIPNGSRIGELLFSGGIHDSRRTPPRSPPMKRRRRRRCSPTSAPSSKPVAGPLDDVIRVSVTVRDRAAARDAINVAWVEGFPDEYSRPARHVTQHELPQPMRMQCDCIAVIQSS